MSENSTSRKNPSLALMACIFATGLAGIVAEYVMATLASYLLGDAVKQWTLTISLMLFAMGIGSRLSRRIRGPLLDAFVAVELALSVLCAMSALAAYFLAIYVEPASLVIYPLAGAIGLLIGIEIPLVTRLNALFQELRVNISSVMEKDYYGALLGGVLFAYFALPYLGLTYTPIVLGALNYLVAAFLFFRFRDRFQRKRALGLGFAVVPVLLAILLALARPIQLYSEQTKYRDLVVYQERSVYQSIVLTRWKEHHWLYLNGSAQFSSYDEERYHEPLVHPALSISSARGHILVLGGGDGLAVREILKYPEVESVTLVDIDPAVTELAITHPVLERLNRGSLRDPRVEIVNRDAYRFLLDSDRLWDVILIDLPDPKTVGLARLYSVEFYRVARHHLAVGGALVTQATSPFFSPEAFLCILRTLRESGMPAVALHNHVPTMGEWGWVIALNAPSMDEEELKRRLMRTRFTEIETRFLDRDALWSMLHFGKGILDGLQEVRINNELDLVLFRYYQDGRWDLY